MSLWFRAYCDALDNPKIQLLEPELFKAWFNLMALAKMNNGRIASVSLVAFRLRVGAETARRYLDALSSPDNKLLDYQPDGSWVPHDWEHWQYESDKSVERMRKYRGRVKGTGCKVNGYDQHRAAVYSRDGHKCVYCLSPENLCIDHVTPVILGGDDSPSNLVTSCKSCNSGKTGRTPDQAGMVIRNSETLKAIALRSPIPAVTVTPPNSYGNSDVPEQSRAEQNRAEQSLPAAKAEPKPVSPLEIAIQETAGRIYARHPERRRDCSVGAVVIKLRAILKRQRKGYPEAAKIQYLKDIDTSHSAKCMSIDWQKDGGEFAKALEGWLAPTMERYLPTTMPSATPLFSLANLPGHMNPGLLTD